MVHPRVFFDFAVDDLPVGRVIFELYNDTAPKTSENFRALCTGEKGLSPTSERPLYYKNSIIHRSIKGFMIQGGDFTKRNGTGGESIYGAPFPDEDLSRPLDSEGLLCMANKGPNTNNSQFFITLRDCPHLNGKHVVFGRVIRGYDIVERIVDVPTDEKDRPSAPVVIANSGELMLRATTQTKEPEPESAVQSAGESASDDDRGRKRRRPRSPSPSPSQSRRSESQDPESKQDRKRHKSHKKSKVKEKKHEKSEKSKSKKKNKDRSKDKDQPAAEVEPVSETESQYDARLEREEQERIEAARRRELERVAAQLKAAEGRRAQESGGVRFKGRGRMKYLDPELQRDRS